MITGCSSRICASRERQSTRLSRGMSRSQTRLSTAPARASAAPASCSKSASKRTARSCPPRHLLITHPGKLRAARAARGYESPIKPCFLARRTALSPRRTLTTASVSAKAAGSQTRRSRSSTQPATNIATVPLRRARPTLMFRRELRSLPPASATWGRRTSPPPSARHESCCLPSATPQILGAVGHRHNCAADADRSALPAPAVRASGRQARRPHLS